MPGNRHIVRALACVIFATLSFAQDAQREPSHGPSQSQDFPNRLRRVFLLSGQDQTALAALAAKQYSRLEQMLAGLHPQGVSEQAEAKSLQGVAAFMDGRMGAAVESLERAADVAPLKDADSFTLAMAYVSQGDAEHARPVLSSLTAKHPMDAIYLYWLGRLDYYQRRYEEAVAKLKKASELDTASARIWNSLGLAYDMQGLTEPARDALGKAVQFNRKERRPSPWPPHDLGTLLLRIDDAKGAEPLLREALKYDPNMPEAHLHLGRALEVEGQREEAVHEYEAAVKLDAASPDACYPLAMLYKKLHRESDAEGMFAEFRKRKQAAASTASP
jgi:Flp pilus assembly protein TadD